MAGILALDLASRVGYAIEIPGVPPLLGTKHFPRFNTARTGPQGLEFMRWLRGIMIAWGPERVIYERPLPPKFQSSTAVASIAMGFAYVTEIVSAELHIPVASVPVSTVRKFFIGDGSSNKRAKGRVIQECERRGWEPPDDNAADAAAVLAWAVNAYYPNSEPRRTAIGNPARLL